MIEIIHQYHDLKQRAMEIVNIIDRYAIAYGKKEFITREIFYDYERDDITLKVSKDLKTIDVYMAVSVWDEISSDLHYNLPVEYFSYSKDKLEEVSQEKYRELIKKLSDIILKEEEEKQRKKKKKKEKEKRYF